MNATFFLLSLIFILSRSTFIGDLKFTSSAFSMLREILFVLKQLFKCFISRLTSLCKFLQIYLYNKDLYHQESDAFCSIELPYGDHQYKLRKEEVLGQNLVVHHNQVALNQNYIH